MTDFSTYEYAVSPDRKRNRTFRRRRVLMIISYVLFPLLFILFFTVINFPWAIFFVAFATVMYILMSWRRVIDYSYEYSITSGYLTLSKIHGNSSRKTIVELTIKDAAAIAPLTDTVQRSRLDAYAPDVVYNALSCPDAVDGYFLIWRDENDRKCALLFEATAQALKIFRFYTPAATVISKVRY